jgi:hypothetical protein
MYGQGVSNAVKHCIIKRPIMSHCESIPIQFLVIVVSFRNRDATRVFIGSPLRGFFDVAPEKLR